MPNASPIGSIPTEIWIMIFDHLLKTWLLPHRDFDLVDRVTFLESGCASIREYFRLERVKTSLRLVCRQWNAIIPTFRFIIEDLIQIPNHGRDADRLHMNERCWCIPGLPLTPCKARKLLDELNATKTRQLSVASIQREFRTRVLTTSVFPTEWDEDSLARDAPLQALSITSHGFKASKKLHSSSTLQRITHLRLKDGGPPEVLPISLPSLTVLDYDAYISSKDTKTPVPMAPWKLPKLRTLILRQVSIAGKVPPAWTGFILSHRLTLVELVVYGISYAHREPNGFLELVPHLTELNVFGTDIATLCRRTPDLAVHCIIDRERSLLLGRFSFIELTENGRDWIKESFEAIFIHYRLFTQIWLFFTWIELAGSLLGRSYLSDSKLAQALQHARDLGIPIKDRDGLSLDDNQWDKWAKGL
ncbi:hypothetical protein FRC17_008086 [Serendipita sp. 399]|nr:hypothetical protein FRC17_008086 [Serendipita sp. 399]